MTDEFGYRPDQRPSGDVVAVQVAEGKDDSTLQPLVILYVRFAMDPEDDFAYFELEKATDLEVPGEVGVTEQFAMPLSIDQAESIRAELDRWIRRAREKHWEN